MTPMDYLKALGVAILLFAINLVIVIAAVFVYSQWIEPGQPREFYDDAAQRIAPWCTRTAGVAAFFVVSYLLARRRPGRNAVRFAATFAVIYIILDAAMVGFVDVFNVEFGLAMLANLLAALAGAFVAARSNRTNRANY